MVSEMSFLECQLDSNAVEFFVCDGKVNNEKNTKKKKITFHDGSTTSDGIAFTPGHSYYFICK